VFDRNDLREIAAEARGKVFAAAPELDVIISTDPTHVGYLGGYRSLLLDMIRFYQCAIVATRDSVHLVTGASDAAAALEVIKDPASIYRYGEFYVESATPGTGYLVMPPPAETFQDALRAAIDATVRSGQSIGIDAVDAPGLKMLEELAGRGRNVRQAILSARTTKTPSELAILRLASEITERGMQRALEQAHEGMTELELSRIISSEIIVAGGIPRFVVVTSGARSALVDAYATPKKLAKGDLLRLDVGGTVNGYWSDTARTAVVGKPTNQQLERYEALLAGEQAQLARVRAGMPASELFDVAIAGVREGALPNYRRNHCGHGIGLAAHEFPTIGARSRDVQIVEGMVLNVETPYYEIGWGGMMVEDTFVVTKNGIDYLTTADRSLRVI
jgi:Xaa-Pro aminopeptidase